MATQKPYEVIVLMHPDTTLDDQKALFRKNAETIKAFNGNVFSLETWGKRNLGNPIGKIRKAVYFHSLFEADTQAIAEIERTMRINDRVMRFMHTRLDERVSLAKYQENFKKGLQDSAAREKEREAKIAARKAAFAAARSDRPERGDREDRGDRGDRGGRFDRGDRE